MLVNNTQRISFIVQLLLKFAVAMYARNLANVVLLGDAHVSNLRE
jgi:hypothetical protein